MTNPYIRIGGYRRYLTIGWQDDKRIKQYGYQLNKLGFIYFWRIEILWDLK